MKPLYKSNILICPVCRRKNGSEAPLSHSDDRKTWFCPSKHCFDMASSGYLNLLPPSKKQVHGDNKEMIAARRALLDSGVYAPLKDKLSELLQERLDDGSVVWDSGCGEGYYTAAVAQGSSERGWSVYGSDLSKDALKGAAKREHTLRLIAASSYALPALSSSCDALLCLFAPQAIEEFYRILKPNGLLFQAVPGERHLFGLKEVLYDRPYENEVDSLPPAGFTIADRIEIKYSVTLTDSALILDLFGMTPYAYRTSQAGIDKLRALEALTTELHFYIFIYQKH